MFNTILFDLDGTLSDSGEGIMGCVRYALGEMGIRVEDPAVLRRYVGPPLLDSFMKDYQMDRETAQKTLDIYRERFVATGIYENSPYPGIEDLLRDLKAAGKTLGVATAKPEHFAVDILERYGFITYFDVLVGCDLEGVRNTKTEVLMHALEKLGIKEEEKAAAVLVGDRKYDMRAAKQCGISGIGVYYGYAEEGELEAAGADYIVQSVSELRNLLFQQA